jgi:hypothetical protein
MKNLIQALVKAQSVIQPAEKNAVNPHFKSRYADLDSIMRSIREPLASNGLALTQVISMDEQERMYLTTTLHHISGEEMNCKVLVISQRKDAQGYGSALTYFRRYSITSLLCLVASDEAIEDDGEAAQGREVKTKQPSEVKAPPIDLKKLEQRDLNIAKRLDRLNFMSKKWTKEDLMGLCQCQFGKAGKDLNFEEVEKAFQIVEKHADLNSAMIELDRSK